MGRKLPTTPRSRIKNAIRQVFLRSRERAAALKATGHRCAKCGIKASEAKGRVVKLQVHHVNGIDWDGVVDLVYERVLAGQMQPLCVSCHGEQHGRMPIERTKRHRQGVIDARTGADMGGQRKGQETALNDSDAGEQTSTP